MMSQLKFQPDNGECPYEITFIDGPLHNQKYVLNIYSQTINIPVVSKDYQKTLIYQDCGCREYKYQGTSIK